MSLLVWNLLMPLKWSCQQQARLRPPASSYPAVREIRVHPGDLPQSQLLLQESLPSPSPHLVRLLKSSDDGHNSKDPARASQTGSGSTFHTLPQPHSHCTHQRAVPWFGGCLSPPLRQEQHESILSCVPGPRVYLHTLMLQWWTDDDDISDGLWEPDTVLQMLTI